ncbi:MAG: Xaa-Pro dipeptidase [Myxococcota bacterium]
MNPAVLFTAHVRAVEEAAALALATSAEQGAPYDVIVFYSGGESTYHADDLAVPFRGHAHFLRFAPVEGAGHFVVYAAGGRAVVLRATAADYWHARPQPLADWVSEGIEVRDTSDPISALVDLIGSRSAALVGGDDGLVQRLGLPEDAQDPEPLLAALNWLRATKTPYEMACMQEAQRIAGVGHAAVRIGFAEGLSEFDLHLAYLEATRLVDSALPYPNIIARDSAAAVLHYQHRRIDASAPGATLLIDAGAMHNGYASDITRTYCAKGTGLAAAEFTALLNGMEALQQTLVAAVAPGVSFVALHRQAEVLIATLLCETGVLRCKADEATERRLVETFFPHGLGHHLGLQVHDVGGRQIDICGAMRVVPDDCPNLRTTRDLSPGHVVTIEPGLYFIPVLLDRLRGSPEAACVDWARVERLAPLGGIRIEDDVLVTVAGFQNLTRPYVPGHLDEPQ